MKKHPRKTGSAAKSANAERFPVPINQRELATILAALRFHQDENLQGGGTIPDQVILEIATNRGALAPLSLYEVRRLSQRMQTDARTQLRRNTTDKESNGTMRQCPGGLLISPAPKERSSEPLFRVVYIIDVNGVDARKAAKSAYQIMSDPDSMPPVLHVLDGKGHVAKFALASPDKGGRGGAS